MEIDWDDIKIADQYGREMTTAQKRAAAATGVNGTVYSVMLSEVSSGDQDNISIDKATLNGTAATIDGVSKGSDKLVLTLVQGGTTLSETAFETSIRVTDGTEYTSYEVETVGTIFDENEAGTTDADEYDKEIKVYGVLADGSKIRLVPGTEFTAKSTLADLTADATDGVIDANAYSPTYAANTNTKVVPLTITINATGETFAQDVTFTSAAPSVNSVKVVKDNALNSSSVSTVEYDVDALGADFSIADLTTGTASDYNVLVTDQYGATVLATATSGAVTFADGSTGSAPTVTIVPVKGEISISNNGLATASVADSSLAAGEEFNVTLTYAGGAKATVKVIAE